MFRIDWKEMKELVKFGYKQGLVKIIFANWEDDCGCDGIACRIGNGCFYFAGMTGDEYDNVGDYLKDTDVEDNLNSITNAIVGIHEDIEDGDEYGEAMYYYRFLKEQMLKLY